jgi:hypothetical protein
MTVQYSGSVITSRSGALAVRLVNYDGLYPLPGRDAHGLYFDVQLQPASDPSRLAVLFSGLSIGSEWSWYGLPEITDKERRLIPFAEAAVGEQLDSNGLPDFTPSGVDAFKIECFSYTFQEWKKRARGTDEEILQYIEARVYWSWRFAEEVTVFRRPDFLRFHADLLSFERLAMLGDGVEWNRIPSSEYALHLQPTPQFIRQQRDQRRPQHTNPAEALLSSLQAPRYAGPFQHWQKALEFRTGAKRDLANAAKEAVSAVEGLARVITGQHTETLGDLIKRLRTDRKVDGAMAKTLEGIWGFASNAPGVRHGGATPPTLSDADLDFVMTASEGALRYLLQLDK